MLNTLSNLERSTFFTAGNKGNTGAIGAVPIQAQHLNPATQVATFEIIPTAPYNNGYWYLDLTKNQKPEVIAAMIGATKITLGLKFTIKEEDFNNTRCVEYEAQQINDGYLFNYAWQIRIKRDMPSALRIFNYGKHQWESTPFAVKVKPDTKHHIYANFIKVPDGTIHSNVNFDDTNYTLGTHHPKVDTRKYDPANPSKVLSMSRNKFTVGFQLDTQAGIYVDSDNDGTKEFHGEPAIADVVDYNLKYGD